MSKDQDDKLRLATVQEYAIFENGQDENLDEITEAAAKICKSKYSFISIVDDKLIKFISKSGFKLTESIREKSGCDIVVKTKKPFIVEDVMSLPDGYFDELYTKKFSLKSYAGFPLITKEGVVIGTLSVADDEIKHLSHSEVLVLETFAKQVVRSLEANKANFELEKINVQFNEVQEISKTGHWELCIETNNVEWTSGIYDIYGIEHGIPFDKVNAISYYAPHEREKITKVLSDSISNGSSFCEDFEFKDSKGTEMWVRSSGHPVKNESGEVVKLVGTFQDITNIRTQQQNQQFIFDTMKVGTFSWNISKDILNWDDSNYSVFGTNKNDFSGAFEAWESTLHPDWKESAVKDLNDALEGNSEFSSTFGIMTKEGEIRYVGARGIIKRDDLGNPISMVGINWDKTNEHVTLMELEKQKVVSFHHDKLASLGALAAGVGHEINNPMAIIQGHCDTLKIKSAKGNLGDQDLSHSLSHIEKAINRVTSIVKGLKNISRQDGLEAEHFELNELLTESVGMISEIYEKEGVKIELCLESEKFLFANRGKIQQVLINLLSNSKDSIKNKLNDDNKTILVKVQNYDDSKIRLEVQDNGGGIPVGIQKKVFDPFFSSKAVNEGTGIGLSLCHQIIEEHKGKIYFESTEGVGTTFFIELPLSSEQVYHEETDSLHFVDTSQLVKQRVLIAEDEIGIQEILSLLLEELGYDVVAKDNGFEALEEYKKNKESYDLIISDIQMPIMNGLEFYKSFQQLSGEKIPFVIMTGGVNSEHESLVKSVDAVISKPFTMDTLEDTLAGLFSEIEKKCAS